MIKKTFKVTAAKLPSDCITVNGDTALKKGGAKPQVTVSVNGVKLSFNFKKKKEIGVREIQVGGKTIVEAVV